jgi:hypothetical protein
MKASPEIITFHNFYLTSLTSIITSQVHQTSTLKFKHRNFIQSLSSSGKKTRSSIVDSDTTMKPICGITWQSHCWPGTDPTRQSNQSAKHTATSKKLSYLQKTHLKTLPQARLSILKLSKAYLTSGMRLPTPKHAWL